MPSVTMDELESWIDQFRESERRATGSLRAIDRSWDRTTIDTALVYIALDSSGTQVYLRREIGGSGAWSITFLPRDHASTVGVVDALQFSDDVEHVAHLCAYLTECTQAHFQMQGSREHPRDSAPILALP